MSEQSVNAEISRYVIVLVHGTWAPGATWTQPGSIFRKEIEKNLVAAGATSVEFVDDFRWSGANSHEARREGAARLNRKLHRVVRFNPSKAIFVVAHSHGGNVALRALRLSHKLTETLGGVVCIATPYLRFTPRRAILATLPAAYDQSLAYLLELIFRHWLAAMIGTLFALVGTPIFVLWNHFGPNAIVDQHVAQCFSEGAGSCPDGYFWIMAGIAALAGWTYAGFIWNEGWERARRQMGPLFAEAGNRILRRYGYVQRLPSLPHLSLSSSFDEARAALTGAWWVHITSGILVRIVTLVSAVMAVSTFAALLWGIFLGLQWLRTFPWIYPLAEKTAVLPILASGILLLILLRLTFNLLLPLAAESSFGAGLPDPNTNLILRVHADREVTGSGTSEARRFGVMQLLSESKGFLLHSLIYSHPKAIREIASWMKAVRRPASG